MARETEGIKDESILQVLFKKNATLREQMLFYLNKLIQKFQVIVDLKLSQNPQLVSEHEEFVANINRQVNIHKNF